jgi:hypothetical protein
LALANSVAPSVSAAAAAGQVSLALLPSAGGAPPSGHPAPGSSGGHPVTSRPPSPRHTTAPGSGQRSGSTRRTTSG